MMMNNKLHIFTIIICSLVLISCQPKETSENYLVLRDGLKYERNSLEPFTGITRGQEQYIYKKGLRHGEYNLFLCSPDSIRSNLSESGIYEDNIILESKTYRCGSTKVKKIYRYNGMNEIFENWYATPDAPSGCYPEYYVKEKVKRINGQKEGREEIYHPSGHCKLYLREVYNYKDGKRHDEYLHYHSSGYLSEKGTYSRGKKYGYSIKYYKNGNPKRRDYYFNGKFSRHSIEFDEQGRLIYFVDYSVGFKDGMETRFKYVNEKQIKISTQQYKYFGNKFGLEIHYNDDGSVKESFCWDFKTDRYTGGRVRVTEDDYEDKTQVVSSAKNSLVSCNS